jgi:uncharacterized protein
MSDVRWQRNVTVELHDGVRLANDIYLPRGGGPWPAILERTPYDKLSTDLVLRAKYLARYGYAVVLQDVRGRYGSEGVWYPFGNEGPDGVEAVAWVRGQPWCDGRVATMGLSYSSCTQTSIGALNPPGLAAQFVSQGFHNYHTASMRHGGALEVRFMIYAFMMARTSREALADPVTRRALDEAWTNVRAWLRQAPPRAGLTPLRHVPSIETWLLDIWQHGDYDAYWRGRPAYSIEDLYTAHADVPMYFCGSWYDSYARSSTTNYVELSRRKRGPVRLIMGPWLHGDENINRSYAGDADFGPDAALGYDDFLRRWFDAVLKDAPTGLLEEPPVRLFVMGGGSGRKLSGAGRLDVGGRWRSEPTWPLARARQTAYFLHPGGELVPVPPPGGAPPSRYLFDPLDPVPTVGGNISAGFDVMIGGGFDQRAPGSDGGPSLSLSARRDVLVFSTPPLRVPVEVTGTVVVELWAASSAPDTDFTAKLIDVYPTNEDYPEGYELNIGDSIIRARYRNSPESAELMETGTVYRFRIELYPTATLFATGHRIRLHISSSNFPRFDVNPNTGGPLGREQAFQRAVQTIYHDARHPSRVMLPVIPG